MTAAARGSRALRRADLLKLIDDAALVAVPIEQLAAAFQADPAAGISRTRLLAPVDGLPLPAIRAARTTLVDEIDAARSGCGLAVVSGATGVGKSLLAKLVATRGTAPWSIAHFLQLSPTEASARLGHLQGELAGAPATHVILDDLNGLDDPEVRETLARLLAGLRRRDATAIITIYRAPVATTLQQFVPGAATPIEVTYLDADEVADLVIQVGGDAKYAGSVYRACANGHPLMTMAALLRLQGESWSRRSIAAVLGGELQSELGAERRAVRERLVRVLPEDAQTLLLRTSLVRGGFDRKLAIRIAGLDPVVPRAGLSSISSRDLGSNHSGEVGCAYLHCWRMQQRKSCPPKSAATSTYVSPMRYCGRTTSKRLTRLPPCTTRCAARRQTSSSPSRTA